MREKHCSGWKISWKRRIIREANRAIELVFWEKYMCSTWRLVKSRIYVISKNNYLQRFPYQHEDLDLGEPPVVVKSWHEMCLSCMLCVVTIQHIRRGNIWGFCGFSTIQHHDILLFSMNLIYYWIYYYDIFNFLAVMFLVWSYILCTYLLNWILKWNSTPFLV